MRILQLFLTYLAAVVTTSICAVLAGTQRVLAQLQALDVPISFNVRLQTSAEDLLGMGPVFGLVVALAWGLAMPVALWLRPRLQISVTASLVLAGAAAMLSSWLLMQLALGMMPIAGARGGWGLAWLTLAGAAGGWLAARLYPQPH